MKALHLAIIVAVYIFLVVEGAALFDPPFRLVATIVIGPFMAWLCGPLFRRRPADRRERPDDRCAPSLLDLLPDRWRRLGALALSRPVRTRPACDRTVWVP